MAKTTFTSVLNAMAREAARQQRLREAEIRRLERQRQQQVREAERAAERASAALAKMERAARTAAQKASAEAAKAEAEAARLEKERYLASRMEEVEGLNRDLASRVAELSTVLERTLTVNDAIDLDSLRIRETFPDFQPEAAIAIPLPAPDREVFRRTVSSPSGLGRLLPGAAKKQAKDLAAADEKYEAARQEWERYEAERRRRLEVARAQYDEEYRVFQGKVAQRDREVDELAALYRAGDADAVVAYNSMVLERSEYPEGFPQEFRIAYVPESKEVVIDYELPGPSIVPTVAEYSYVKSKDEITQKPRRPADAKGLYQDIVAAVCLRTCHEVFEADQVSAVEVVAFNGFVQAVDPATGQNIRPCLISVRVTKERFAPLDLSRIDKAACLRNLGAQVSPRPHEVQPVKPIVEFDMVDRRFVEQSDVLADLDSRQNLMDLTPFEFEHLIANLFTQIGLETRLTRSSRDGGVDVVAYDARPVLGGKVVIQAKRWRNTVGVSAVRDLYGTMMNEGANKGILVTTSGYGPDAFDFSKDKPIELMDGGQLLYMLSQAGVQAKILFPEDSV